MIVRVINALFFSVHTLMGNFQIIIIAVLTMTATAEGVPRLFLLFARIRYGQKNVDFQLSLYDKTNKKTILMIK